MSYKGMYSQIKMAMGKAGIENPALEARLILKHVLGVTDADLITGDFGVSPAQQMAIDAILTRRRAGEPLSRIFGEREFYGLPFYVTPDVLDPRSDTETLVDAALKRFAGRPPPRRILDLGTGSGCILITLLSRWPQAHGVGIDLSPAALAVAADNADRNGVANRALFVPGDWLGFTDCHPERREGSRDQNTAFDLIVSNPPYIESATIPDLEAGVRNFDPILALDGGKNGLGAYEKIFSGLKNTCHIDSIAFFEIGQNQGPDVARLAADHGFSVIESYRDLAGVERVLEIALGKTF